MDKAPDAFRTISEVAEDLDLPQHVLRFWETRFPQIKPLKRGGGRRYYRPDDVLLLKGIRHLLYGEGYTIKGVQRIIKEQGAKHIMALWQDDHSAPDDALTASYNTASPPHEAYAPPLHREQIPFWEKDEEATAHVFADDENEDVNLQEDRDDAVLLMQKKAHIQPINPHHQTTSPIPPQPVVPTPLAEQPQAQHKPLSPDNSRKLQATLYELMECKRILEGAR